MIDNTKNKMRILYYISGYPPISMPRIQEYIVDTWSKKGSLFSTTIVAENADCSRGQAQKAIRQLEKRGVVKRRCGGYKTRWNAILCDECKREFEQIDIRFFARAILSRMGNWSGPSKLRPALMQRISYERGNPIHKQWGWQYEGRVCSECLTKLLRKPELETVGISSVILGFKEL